MTSTLAYSGLAGGAHNLSGPHNSSSAGRAYLSDGPRVEIEEKICVLSGVFIVTAILVPHFCHHRHEKADGVKDAFTRLIA